MLKRFLSGICFAGLLGFSVTALGAKTPQALQVLDTQIDRNQGVMDQWLQFPERFSQPMLTASQYPEVLGRLGRLQTRTRGQYQSLIRDLKRSEQEQVYELTRYPNLLAALGGEKKLSNSEIKKTASEYPEEAQKAARALGRKKYGLLRQINQLNQQSRSEFDRFIQDLPPRAQDAYRELLQVPELLSSMEENMPLTVALGEAYREAPSATERKLEGMRAELEKRNSDAVADFNEDLKNNPQAAQEMRQVAQQYAKENNIDLYEVDEVPTTTTVYVGINPYPYWFGWPFWYPYAYWRPYPYWWGFGFYFGPGWGIGYWGYPSYWYSNWFWGYYPNYYRYPYLCSYYWRQYNYWRPYYGYRNGYWRGYPNGFFRATDRFYQNRGRYVLENHYIRDGRTPARFSELGQLERSYTRFRATHPEAALSRGQFYRSRGATTQQTREGPTIRSTPRGTTRGTAPTPRGTSGGRGPMIRSGSPSTPRSRPASPAHRQNLQAPAGTRSSGRTESGGGTSFGTERRGGSNYRGTGGGFESSSPGAGGGSIQRGGPGGGSSSFRGGSSMGGSRGGSSSGGFRGGGGGGFRGGGGGGFRR